MKNDYAKFVISSFKLIANAQKIKIKFYAKIVKMIFILMQLYYQV